MSYRCMACIPRRTLSYDFPKKCVPCGCITLSRNRSSRESQWRKSLMSDCQKKYNNRSLYDNKEFLRICNFYKTDYVIYHLSINPSSRSNFIPVRGYRSSSSLYKEESVVEKSVNILKKRSEKTDDDKVPLEVSETFKTPTISAAQEPKTTEQKVSEPAKEVIPPKKTLVQRFVDECKHYYHGFRLFFIELKISVRLIWRLLNGKTLTRREHKQLIRTVADLFRMVPFLIFVIVPFMEFLIPVALKLFPNMLPSTFQAASKEEENVKKRLKVKLEMAKFLQDTVEETALTSKTKKSCGTAEEFSAFITNIRRKGIQPSNEEILKFSKFFENELTLDNLRKEQLMALCRVLEISPIGTEAVLKFQLRWKLKRLLVDDKMIMREGIDNLSPRELQQACRNRGMRAVGVPQERLKNQLQQWLDLHLKEKIPNSLLLLSRALYLPETLSTTEQLTETISALPESMTSEAKIKVSETLGGKVPNKEKLDVIRQQEEAIKKEEAEKVAEADKVAEAEKIAKEQEEKVVMEMDVAEAVAAEKIMDTADVLQDTAIVTEAQPGEELTDLADEEITTKDLEEIEVAIGEIAKEKQLDINNEELKEDLEDLKEDMEEYKEDVEDLKAVILTTNEEIEQSKSAKKLTEKLNKVVKDLDRSIVGLLKEKEEIQTEIEVSEVRLKRSQELQEDEDKREKFISDLKKKKKSVISINELLLALKRMQRVPDDARLQRIVQVLDEDRDGSIEIAHVLKVIELLGKENVKLNSSQVSEITDLVKQEMFFEKEEKTMEKKEKELKKNCNGSDETEKVVQQKQ